jgi:NAD(P)-dependent dehydrogenase (short-subunit alcohol dehydrogenase family)
MKLYGRTLLITGASSGLGRAIALSLAKANNTIIITARRRDLLESLAKEIAALGSRAFVCVNDATDTADCQRVMAEAISRFGGIDMALLNVGGAAPQTMGTASASADAVLATMRKNYDSLVNYLCPLIEHMRVRGGTIAYTCSPAGAFGLPKSGPYGAAKSAGRVLFDSCRIELAHTPIRLVALYPGFTYTEGLAAAEVPLKALIIQKERAVREMIDAIERGRSHTMFPRRIRWPVTLAAHLPEPVRRFVLRLAVRPAA